VPGSGEERTDGDPHLDPGRHARFGEAIRSALLDAKMDVLQVITTGRDAIMFSNATDRMCS
jgi:hypothetical protein